MEGTLFSKMVRYDGMISNETRELLILLADRYETAEFIVGDPSWWMHQVQGTRNQEATAFVASGLSYGSRSQFMPRIGQLLEWAGSDMDSWLRTGAYQEHFALGDKNCFYRLYNNDTMRRFLDAYRAMLVEHGSMGEYLSALHSPLSTQSKQYVVGSAITMAVLWCLRTPHQHANASACSCVGWCATILLST